jgi:RNase P/RNase MRP subunit p29
MKTKTIQALVILLAVGSLKAQSASDPSGSANTRHSKPSKGEITLQGCLGRATGDYILTQTDPGNTFKLEKANRKLKLGPHLGEQVLVTGWKSPTLSSSSDALNRAGPPSSVTLMVTSISTVEKECTAREVTVGAAAGPVTGAELEVSSTPDDADVEIDGNFVGNTMSTIIVASGQHKVAVRKSGYKPWERTIAVTSGRVKVHAELEPEAK